MTSRRPKDAEADPDVGSWTSRAPLIDFWPGDLHGNYGGPIPRTEARGSAAN